mmetsp:Transcript_10807/g.20349  ORF Transcript_10807/g.20349 Transcript_10807/m.20349 type:complete len:211 (+) Transcript_10807:177-809(+)
MAYALTSSSITTPLVLQQQLSSRKDTLCPTLGGARARMPSRVTMPRRKAKAMRVSAILIQEDLSSPFEKVLKDSCTGIEFPLLNDFSGVMQRCVGLGQKKRSFFFAGLFASDEYSIAMYVCPELCAKELSSRFANTFCAWQQPDECSLSDTTYLLLELGLGLRLSVHLSIEQIWNGFSCVLSEGCIALLKTLGDTELTTALSLLNCGIVL